MASLAQPKPASPRKPLSVRDRWRGKTNYQPKRFTGFAPISFAMVAEVGRLTTGKATQLLYVILTASLGQIVKKTEAFKELAADLATSDLAELCGCDERTVQRELADLKYRKIILWEQSKKGVNVVTPLFRSWAAIEDYRPGPVLEPESDDEPLPDDPAENVKGQSRVVITRKPAYVKAGATSKRYPVETGVTHFETKVKGGLDAECSAVVENGVFQVIIEAKWNGRSVENFSLNGKGLEEKPRQGCRISPKSTESKERKSERRSKSEDSSRIHPRAVELAELFDPLLLKHSHRSLSADAGMLEAASSAIADTPHEFLVRALKDRASRQMLVQHVKPFCKEVAANWKKLGAMNAERAKSSRIPTWTEEEHPQPKAETGPCARCGGAGWFAPASGGAADVRVCGCQSMTLAQAVEAFHAHKRSRKRA